MPYGHGKEEMPELGEMEIAVLHTQEPHPSSHSSGDGSSSVFQHN